jgi:gluconate 5-dehydrogenase
MKNYFDLTGQVAIVTGASTGLGLQMAKAFANQGANLVLLARRMNLLEENARIIHEEFGVEVLPFACDITDTERVKEAVKATMDKFGRVDILMNNAGTGAVANAEDITDEQFKKELDIDLFGTFVCSREFGKEMIKAKYGRIINIASM